MVRLFDIAQEKLHSYIPKRGLVFKASFFRVERYKVGPYDR